MSLPRPRTSIGGAALLAVALTTVACVCCPARPVVCCPPQAPPEAEAPAPPIEAPAPEPAPVAESVRAQVATLRATLADLMEAAREVWREAERVDDDPPRGADRILWMLTRAHSALQQVEARLDADEGGESDEDREWIARRLEKCRTMIEEGREHLRRARENLDP